MSRLATTAKVGVFVAATSTAALAIYQFIDNGRSTGQGYVVYALFNDAMGIAKHSQVRVSGIPIGRIIGVRLDQGKARIDIRINKSVTLFVDASAAKVSSSLLGEYYLSIAPGTEGRDVLNDGDQIQVAVDAVTTDSLIHDMSSIAQDLKRVSAALAESVGTKIGKGNIKDTLKHLAKVTEALNATVRENRESVQNILAQVEAITSGAKRSVT